MAVEIRFEYGPHSFPSHSSRREQDTSGEQPSKFNVQQFFISYRSPFRAIYTMRYIFASAVDEWQWTPRETAGCECFDWNFAQLLFVFN